MIHTMDFLLFLLEDISSPISAQIFEFCEHDLFPETLQNSEVSSCSNCCYEDISYTTTLSSSLPSDVGSFNSGSTCNTTTISNGNNYNNNNNISIPSNHHLSTIFDSHDENDNTDLNEISGSKVFFSQPPPSFSINNPSTLLASQEDQFDLSSLEPQIGIVDGISGFSSYSPDQVVHQLNAGPPAPTVPPIFEEDCLASLPSYVNLDPSSPSCSFMDPTVGQFFPGTLSSSFPTDMGLFAGTMLMGSELQPQELEFQGENGGVYGSEPIQYNSTEIQALDNQQLVNGGGGSSTPLTTEISSLEESSYKIGRLSVEERKEKIHRYMKKRNERNFSKKIKYACRKTLADSRPRVRGRFAKNDDFGEATRPSNSIHEDDDDEEIPVKEEDDMVDTSDIFAHISGVNSFKCNYPIQSWI